MYMQGMLAVLSGGIIGLLLGATGGGGSLIAIPLLVYVVGIPVQNATAMSLVVVGYSALFGAWQASRIGEVRGLAAVLFSSTGMIGAWLGAQGHRLVQGEVILLLFGMLMIGIGIATWHRGLVKPDTEKEKGCAQQFSTGCAIKAVSIGFAVGLLTGFFGIGGGFIIVPALLFVMGFPLRMAVGTSLLIISLTSLGGIVGHLSVTSIDLVITALIIGGSLLGILGGGRLARVVSGSTLTKAFATLAGLIGLFVVVDNAIRLVT